MTNTPTIFLIGSGNVAWHLSVALAAKGCRFVGIYNRTPQHAQALGEKLCCPIVSDLEQAPKDADLYLICTSDRAIASVSAQLPENSGLVAHVSGAAAIDDIDKKHERRGVMYPLQTFNKGRFVDLTDVPIFVEAAGQSDVDFLMALARLISDTVILLEGEQRKALHTAAVFACNFTNFMYGLSAEIMQENGLDFQLLLPLIRETAKRMETTNDPMTLQTGPAVRNDVRTIGKHYEFLKNRPGLQELYEILTLSISRHTHGKKL